MNQPEFNALSVRLPRSLYMQLKQQAESNRRSLSAEIVYRLETSRDQQQATQGGRQHG